MKISTVIIESMCEARDIIEFLQRKQRRNSKHFNVRQIFSTTNAIKEK